MTYHAVRIGEANRSEIIEALACLGPVICKPNNIIIINNRQFRKLRSLWKKAKK